MEFSNQLDTKMPSPGDKSSHVKHFAYIGGKRFVVGDELRRAVECPAGQTRNLGALEIIRIFHGNIRTEITDDFVPPFVIEIVRVFQELLPVDRKPPPFIPLSGVWQDGRKKSSTKLH